MENLSVGDKHVGNIQHNDALQRQKIQQQLDEALDSSFPASDPVSIVTSHAEEDWGEPREEPAVEKKQGA
jgi:hypothetical protein